MGVHSKLDKLKNIIAEMGSVLVAFSGGVDSTFLLKMAHDVLGKNAIAVTAKSASYPKVELQKAKEFTKQNAIKHIIINSDETDLKEFKANPVNRCYHCKKELFSKLKQIAQKNGVEYVLDASNYDDIKDFRPGMKAARELNIQSPLIKAKFTKAEIRILSKDIRLETWDKPSLACLASRFPYGTKITKERLNIIEKSENYLKKLSISQVRVRYHDTIARIEVIKEDFPIILKYSEKIEKYLKKLGFKYVTLDLKGYRSGSMNEVIPCRKKN